jgi:hypothetical protein
MGVDLPLDIPDGIDRRDTISQKTRSITGTRPESYGKPICILELAKPTYCPARMSMSD